MRRLSHKIIIYLLFIASALQGLALPTDLSFRHFEVKDGLSSACVRSVIQDSDGFIWFGTDEGLDRYDAIGIRNFDFRAENGTRYISSLVDLGDYIYLGAEDGLYRFDYRKEHFVKINAKTSTADSIENLVSSIAVDNSGRLWIGTRGDGVFCYIPSTDTLVQYPTQEPDVFKVFIDSENRIWALSTTNGTNVLRLDKGKKLFEIYNDRDGLLKDITTIAEDSQGNILLGTWYDGIRQLDPNTDNIKRTYLGSKDNGGIFNIHTISQYSPNIFLIGSDEGLVMLDIVSGDSHKFSDDEGKADCLSNKFIYSITRDHEGGIWLGTFYGGVNYVSPQSGQFQSFSQDRSGNSVKGKVISRFCEDAKGNIWIGSDDGGLNCYNPHTGTFSNYNYASGRYYNVHALLADEDDLWIGTYAGGVDKVNLRTGAVSHYHYLPNQPGGLDDNSCYSIFKDREGELWFTTMSGVNKYNPQANNFTQVKSLGTLTMDIKQDENGDLWFATQGGGLYRYDKKKDQWRNYYHSDKEGSLASNHVNCIFFDPNGNMLVGTMDGLCLYDEKGDSFDFIDLDIPNKNICAIMEDDDVLWITTGKGLVKYIPEQGCECFFQDDGLCNDQFQPNSAIKASDGSIYVGTVNGFNNFYPHHIATNKVVPQVYITGLEIHNKPIYPDDELLEEAVQYAGEIVLPHDRNSLSILFSSLSYNMPQKNQYSYILEGYDKNWTTVTGQNKATYPNLPAGNYTFRVRGSNNDGLWSETEARITVKVSPPWYLSLPFKILYLLLIALAIIVGIWLFYRHYRRLYREQMRQIKAARERETMEERMKFFTIIAHEIRTPVSLIIAPLEKVMRSYDVLPEPVKSEMNVLERNSQRLLYLVNQLLDFRKVETGMMRPDFQKHNVAQMLRSVVERFEPTLKHQETRLTVNYPDEDFTAIFDQEAVTKIVSNLLTNASKYTSDWINLYCEVNPDREFFSIIVEDNGIGISKSEQEKIFRSFYQVSEHKPGTGIGLALVKNLVELHGGTIRVESQPGNGAKFIVNLPKYQEVLESEEELTEDASQPKILHEEHEAEEDVSDLPYMLIVDDNEELLSFLSSNFSMEYNVLKARNGQEALELLKDHEVEIIISDWIMPVMDGPALVKAVRSDELTSHIPIILLTAKTDIDSKIEGMEVSADIFMEKPFSVQYLESSIKNLRELRRKLKAKYAKTPLAPITTMAVNQSDNEFLTKLNQIIESNFSNPDLSVDFLAEQMAISRSGLFSKIKLMSDVTPNDLIQIVRLKKGAQLLAEKKYRISEICYMVGFGTPSYFAKCFQKQFGVKPSEFAKDPSKYIDIQL